MLDNIWDTFLDTNWKDIDAAFEYNPKDVLEIPDEKIDPNKNISFRSGFCKLAMSLYIDNERLIRINFPVFCRLFKDILYKREVKKFEDEKDSDMYKNLIDSLIDFFKEFVMV